MGKPRDPNCMYFILLGEAEKKLLAATMVESTSVAEAAERLGISPTWFRTRCIALGLPVLLTPGTMDLPKKKLDIRTPFAPYQRSGKDRTEAQQSASLRNIRQSGRHRKGQEKKHEAQLTIDPVEDRSGDLGPASSAVGPVDPFDPDAVDRAFDPSTTDGD